MKISLRGAAAVVGATCLLVVGLDYATYATTGQSMIIGQLNTGDNVTKVQRTTAGPAMEFQTTTGSAPFAVSNVTKVVKLNADLVDGRNGADLQNPVYTFTVGTAGGYGDVSYSLPQVPAGNYLMTYTATFQPDGTPAAPARFSCFSFNAAGTAITSQSTTGSTWTSGYFVGVGSTIEETVRSSGMPGIGCGAHNTSIQNDGWTWGNRPLQVTLVKVNNLTTGNISTASAPAKGTGRASTP